MVLLHPLALLESSVAFWSHLDPSRAFSGAFGSRMEPSGAPGSFMEPHGAFWNLLEPAGTSRLVCSACRCTKYDLRGRCVHFGCPASVDALRHV